MSPHELAAVMRRLTRRCSRPVALGARCYATSAGAAGLLSGRVVVRRGIFNLATMKDQT